ncbi:uncharacterized protein LOC128756304 isoform X2 [Synchiropus splendidus]|uniref:uncharacterized protein LOC128756304 isoform X2 n=1 Tax=Synchiropus splendidus TaxID=270530 RepID=UPI00237D76DF|nr:uncharacterized protein LOC128756304 isoform X2 [Synchiropus splendidus]
MKFIALFFLSNVAASGLEVTGYIGNSVNLASAVDPSWQFLSIKWSIYFNDTLIATCRNQTANTDRFYLFKNRLGLNCSTEDALVYTVELITTDRKVKQEKIKLRLREHLKKPALNKLFSHPVDGGCWIAFQCRPQDEGTSLSWNVNPKSTTSYPQNHPDKNVSVILTFSNHIQHGVEFTCSSSRDSERAESTILEQCPGPIVSWSTKVVRLHTFPLHAWIEWAGLQTPALTQEQETQLEQAKLQHKKEERVGTVHVDMFGV